MEAESDCQAQEEEIIALQSIFGDDFTSFGRDGFQISLLLDPRIEPLKLRVVLPPEYPSKSKPLFELQASWLYDAVYDHISSNLDVIASDFSGQVVVYQWTEWIRENICGILKQEKKIEKINEECFDDQEIECADVKSDDDVAPSTTDVSEQDCVCLIKLDHMRQEARYCACVRRWVLDLGLSGRIFFQGPLILIALHGPAPALREYVKLHRTQLVDVDRGGGRCKERMLHLAHLGPPDLPPPAPSTPAPRSSYGAAAAAASGASGEGGGGEWRWRNFGAERVGSWEALRAELARRGVAPARADAARLFSYARA